MSAQAVGLWGLDSGRLVLVTSTGQTCYIDRRQVIGALRDAGLLPPSFVGLLDEVGVQVSSEQIEALRDEAGAAGDREQVELCDRALAGDSGAWSECAQVIEDARGRDPQNL